MDSFLNQSTYEKFKRDILSFGLKPGETVSAAKIAERYSVSRTPAREALVKLETEGLVEIIPQSKSIISKIDLSLAKQEWFIRYSLETAMTDDFFANVNQADINEMKKYNKEMCRLSNSEKTQDNCYFYQLNDNAFHSVVYRVSNQNLASNVINCTMAHYSRLRFLTDIEDSYRDRTVEGHEKLIKLIEKKDIEGYKESLNLHLHYILYDISDLEKMYPDYFA